MTKTLMPPKTLVSNSTLFIYPFKTVYLNRVEGVLLVISYIIYVSLVLTGFDFESISSSFDF